MATWASCSGHLPPSIRPISWPNLERLNPERDEVKFVVADIDDLKFALDIINKFDLQKRTKEILISPVFGTEQLKEIAVAVSQSGMRLRLNMQLHKYIWGADVHGV
jgi:7-carboxy-7-deazaguanine synthase